MASDKSARALRSQADKITASCSICRKIGSDLFVDFDKGEDLPPEARRLITIIGDPIHWPPITTIEQCPLCRTYYRSTHTLDNDIFQHSDEIRLIRLSKEDGEKEIKSERRRRKGDAAKKLKTSTGVSKNGNFTTVRGRK